MKINEYIILFFLIIIVYLRHPSLIYNFFKYIILRYLYKFNYNFKKKNNKNKNQINTYFKAGTAEIKLKNKDINYLKKCNNVINTLLFLNKYIFNNSLFENKKYFIFSNTFFLKHFIFFPEVDNIIRKNLNTLLEEILGANYKISSFLWQRNLHMPINLKEETYSNFWHYDFKRHSKRWCRLMFYLNDQAEIESIHWFDLKTSTEAFKRELYGRYPQNKLPDFLDKSNHNSSPGDFGTIKIINTADLLHRAGHLEKNKKRDVFFIILDSNLDWPGNPKIIKPPNEKKMFNSNT